MGSSLGVFPNSFPIQIPKLPHSPALLLYAWAPSLPRHLTLRDIQKPNHFFAATFPVASCNSPAILLSIKGLLCHPQEPMTAADNRSVTHDRMRPTQVGFVRGAVQWSGHIQVWPRSVTSPAPARAAPCALTQMLIALLKPDRRAQTKAPLASPQAVRRPGPGLLRRYMSAAC